VPHWCYPRPEDAFALAERITWHQDEPYGSTSIFAQWCVFEAAHDAGLKVMLDGQGADEQLAGYHSCFHIYFETLIRRRRWASLLRAMLQRRMWHGTSLTDQLRAFMVPLLNPRVARLFARDHHVLPPANWLDGGGLRGEFGRSPYDTARESIGLAPVTGVGDMCVLMTQSMNLNMLLHWEDRNSMAHGIEARVPFLDHRLVEFSIGLGDRHKLVGGDTKRVLRRAMRGILPETVRKRRDKLGFTTPEEAWFRGPLREAVHAGVAETLDRFPGLFDPKVVWTLVAEMLDGRRNIDFSLWRIINLGIWGRLFAVSA
jgi:asparagine synthase (glutamine-hydrolysing)